MPESSQEAARQDLNVETDDVLRVSDVGWQCLHDLFAPTGLTIVAVADGHPIPGSHWGDEEAGLIRHSIHIRLDTPVHSVLHEAGHWLLMEESRREHLHTDAKGSAIEEMAVCYLQILLSDQIPTMGRDRMFRDMDSWGYSFRLGCARDWFYSDAEDALAHLRQKLTHANSISGVHIHAPISGIFQ